MDSHALNIAILKDKTMAKIRQVAVQKQVPTPALVQKEGIQASRIESFLRKTVLAALTMLGIGYILTNAPVALLIGHSWSTIPIASQANISAIAARVLILMASIISILLGGLLIFGGVKFYERSQTKGIVLLGVLLGSFYLLSLGVGATFLLSETNLWALMLIVAPILVAVSAASHVAQHRGFRLIGSLLGVFGGVFLAYSIINLNIFDLIFAWKIPFTGPFMSVTILESVIVILSPMAACANSLVGQRLEERPLTHVLTILVALLYGIGAFIGSFVLSMNFWNLVWKSPWTGPFQGISEWTMSAVVFWSASLVLMDIGGILLIIGACLGFIYVAREFSQL